MMEMKFDFFDIPEEYFADEMDAAAVAEMNAVAKNKRLRRRKNAIREKEKRMMIARTSCFGPYIEKQRKTAYTVEIGPRGGKRFFKKAAAKAARTTDTANGNAYKKAFDLTWMVY